MGSYSLKDGTLVVTSTVHNGAMNKRGISKLVHVIPAQPEFKSEAFAKALAAIFGDDLRRAIESRKLSR